MDTYSSNAKSKSIQEIPNTARKVICQMQCLQYASWKITTQRKSIKVCTHCAHKLLAEICCYGIIP